MYNATFIKKSFNKSSGFHNKNDYCIVANCPMLGSTDLKMGHRLPQDGTYVPSLPQDGTTQSRLLDYYLLRSVTH
jgi:hypothetical protein